jgi:hypothetical protein
MMCYKIGYYLKAAKQIELVRMKCEFLIDEFGDVALRQATEIWIRVVNTVPIDHEQMFSKFLYDSGKAYSTPKERSIHVSESFS